MQQNKQAKTLKINVMLCLARVGSSIVASCPWQVEWNLMKETAVFLCLSVCFSFKTEGWAGVPFDLI